MPNRYQHLFENLDAGCLVLDSDHRIQGLNNEAAQLLELSSESAANYPFIDRVDRLSQQAFKAHMAGVFAHHLRQTIQLRLKTPSGLSRLVRLDSRLIPPTLGSQAICFTSFTEVESNPGTKRSNPGSRTRSLGRSKQERGSVATALTDLEGSCLCVDEQWGEIFGKMPNDCRGTDWTDGIHPEDRDDVRVEFKKNLQAGAGLEVEFRVQRPSHATRWISCTASLIHDPERRLHAVAIAALDITGKLRAEEERLKIERRLKQAQRIESMRILASGVAHDFNNLLTSIMGNAALASLDVTPDSPVRDCIHRIESASMRAAELCSKLLIYSGQGHLDARPFDLNQIVRDVRKKLDLLAPEGVSITFKLSEPLPAIMADPEQLGRVLTELVTNSVEAIARQPGWIEVSTGRLQVDRAFLSAAYLASDIQEGEYLYLKVLDNGEGISPELWDRLFDPFYTTRFTGRGLGLASILGILWTHRGTLKVESAVGHETEFMVLIPSLA